MSKRNTRKSVSKKSFVRKVAKKAAALSRTKFSFPRARPATLTLYPDVYRTKLTMSQMARLTFNGTTGVVSFQMRSNSVNSPGISYTYHQPYLYDQFAAIYNKVCVYKTITTVWATSESATVPVMVSITNQGTSFTAYSSYLDVLYDIERKRGIWTSVGPQTGRPKMLSYTTVPARVIGWAPSEYRDAEFVEATSTTINSYNPSQQIPVCISAITSDTSATSTVTFFLKMTYYCEFLDKKTIAHS